MRELLIIDLCGTDYGVWRDEISETIEVHSIHKLPLIPSYIAGMVIVGNRTVTVADISVCMGLPSISTLENGNIFIMQDSADISGFAVGSKTANIEVHDDAVLPIPSFLRTNIVQFAVASGKNLVPVINIKELYRIVQTEGLAHPEFKRVDAPKALISDGGLRLFMSGGEIFAVPLEGLSTSINRPEQITRIAAAPAHVKGISLYHGKIMPVFSLNEMILKGEPGTEEVLIPAEIGGEIFGLLVDGDVGILSDNDYQLMEIPMLARQRWFKSAALRGKEIIPVMELLELVFGHNDRKDDEIITETYTPSSSFETVFGRKDVEVVEFSIFGTRYSLPKAEVRGIMEIKTFRSLPVTKSIVVGISEYDGELLPVIDAGVCFGRRSAIRPDWKMMVIANGDFRALVVTETVFGFKHVDVSNERELPILLPHDIVYGCYIEASDVRIILNIEAMAVNIDWASFRQMTGTSISTGLDHEFRSGKDEFPSLPGVDAEEAEEGFNKVAQNEPLIQPEAIAEVIGEAGTSFDFSNIEPAKEAENIHIDSVETMEKVLPSEEREKYTEFENKESEISGEIFDETSLTSEGTPESREIISSEGEAAGTSETFKIEADRMPAEEEVPHIEVGKTAWNSQETVPDPGYEPLSLESQEPPHPSLVESTPVESAVNHEETSDEIRSGMEQAEKERSGEFIATEELQREGFAGQEEQESLEQSPFCSEEYDETTETAEISASDDDELHAKQEVRDEIADIEENGSARDVQESPADSGYEPVSFENQDLPYPPLDESSLPESGIIREETFKADAEMERAETEEPLGPFVLKDDSQHIEFTEQPEPESAEHIISKPYEEEYLVNPYYKGTEGFESTGGNASASDVKLDPSAIRKILQKDVKEIESPKVISEKRKRSLVYGFVALMLLCAVYLLFINKGEELNPEVHTTSIKIKIEKPPVEVKTEPAIPPTQPVEPQITEQQEVKQAPTPEAASKIIEEKAASKTLPAGDGGKPQISELLKIPPVKNGIYLVKPGDTLWGISERLTGDPYNYYEVAEKNKIEDPDLIFPGQKIKVKKIQKMTD